MSIKNLVYDIKTKMKNPETNYQLDKTENINQNPDNTLENLLNSFKKVVSPKEWEKMVKGIEKLTKEEEKEVKAVIEHTKSSLSELENTILGYKRRDLETINGNEIKEKLKKKISELKEKIATSEGSEKRKNLTKIALLKQALNTKQVDSQQNQERLA